MSSKLPNKRDASIKAKSRLSQDEEIDLEAFCEDIHFDDISFDDWQNVVETLDLITELYITESEAKFGVTKELGFTRMVNGKRITVRLPVDVPAGMEDGEKVVLPAEGDCSNNKQGDLHVMIRLPVDS